MDAYCLAVTLTGACLQRTLLVMFLGDHPGHLQAECLAADRVEVWELRELVVRDDLAVSLLGLVNLLAKLLLNVRVLGQQVEDAREGVGRGVDPGKDKRPA